MKEKYQKVVARIIKAVLPVLEKLCAMQNHHIRLIYYRPSCIIPFYQAALFFFCWPREIYHHADLRQLDISSPQDFETY